MLYVISVVIIIIITVNIISIIVIIGIISSSIIMIIIISHIIIYNSACARVCRHVLVFTRVFGCPLVYTLPRCVCIYIEREICMCV